MEIAALSAAMAPVLTPPVAPAEPTALATAQFNSLMNAPVPAELTGVQAALQSALGPAAEPLPTLGNQILASLQSTMTEFSQKWQGIAGSLEQVAARPAIGDMLKVQADLLQVSVQYELVGKAVSRTTQNVDTLVRMS
ncbi:type III secretion system inner rod subunit SctI [Bordetella sp. BOR01]|uniref:type III secretion system inner rod subunit SctI n=1 Tax=Bordetella sp. BOR01 TaxID=2854779 RepID=UPI001C496237|nr:type III secretion system inner rod subunit SctI [Bordetella sp. BOR01]MBV7485202.1 type III secretion system inner rod subunit SctI [Bordetella sp. BOR01]